MKDIQGFELETGDKVSFVSFATSRCGSQRRKLRVGIVERTTAKRAVVGWVDDVGRSHQQLVESDHIAVLGVIDG